MSVRLRLRTIVLDPSVALKWRLPDEEHADRALVLLDDIVEHRLRVFVPPIFDFEIANSLKVAVSRRRISESAARDAFVEIGELEIERPIAPDLSEEALNLAQKLDRSAYDASYLALARIAGVTFVTGDRRLWNAVKNTFPWVCWIGDYDIAHLSA